MGQFWDSGFYNHIALFYRGFDPGSHRKRGPYQYRAKVRIAGTPALTETFPEALQQYDEERVKATTQVVLTNRVNPPDAILREVFVRSNGKRFDRIDDLISQAELKEIAENYRKVAGFDARSLIRRPSYLQGS